MKLQTGARLGPYIVEHVLGHGAMATVYRVRHEEHASLHALKLLRHANAGLHERLRRESRAQHQLRHPNLVHATDWVEQDERAGIVMEWVDGPDLEGFLSRQHPVDWPSVDRLARGILEGVAEAHRHGILHRDLKPANILVTETNGRCSAKVTDFGLVKWLGDTGCQTVDGQLLGSPAYMAPEQARSATDVDERADVFALGAVLYEMVTGERAFRGPDVVSTLSAVSRGQWTPLSDHRSDVPERIQLAIAGALAVRPDRRIPDCDTLLRVWNGEQAFHVATSLSTLDTAFGDTLDRATPMEKTSSRWPLLGLAVLALLLLLWVGWPQASQPTPLVPHVDAPSVVVGPVRSINLDSAIGDALQLHLQGSLAELGSDVAVIAAADDASQRALAGGRPLLRGAIGQLAGRYTFNLELASNSGKGRDTRRAFRILTSLDDIHVQLGPMLEELFADLELTDTSARTKADNLESLKAVIRRQSGEQKRCYEDALRRDGKLEGNVTLQWELEADGTVRDVVVASSTIDDAAFKECMVREASTWLFPPGMEGTITWPYRFRAFRNPARP